MLCLALAIMLNNGLEGCAPGMIRVADRLRDSGVVADFTRDRIIALTLQVCMSRDAEHLRRWHTLFINRPITDAKLRAEFGRAIERALINIGGAQGRL